jgi:hypothetical protein
VKQHEDKPLCLERWLHRPGKHKPRLDAEGEPAFNDKTQGAVPADRYLILIA